MKKSSPKAIQESKEETEGWEFELQRLQRLLPTAASIERIKKDIPVVEQDIASKETAMASLVATAESVSVCRAGLFTVLIVKLELRSFGSDKVSSQGPAKSTPTLHPCYTSKYRHCTSIWRDRQSRTRFEAYWVNEDIRRSTSRNRRSSSTDVRATISTRFRRF